MRPKIICHMVGSIDGRLLPPRWTPPARGVDPGIVSRIYEEVAGGFDADGWIIGRKSMEDFATGQARSTGQVDASPRTPFVGERKGLNAYSGERDRSFRPIVTAAHEMVLRG